MAFVTPLLLLFIYGYAVTFDVDNISTIVCDMDRSSLSRELINEFVQSRYFTQVATVDRYEDIDLYMDRNQAKVAIIIPNDFSRQVRKRGPTQVAIILDGANSNTANIAQGYISVIAQRFTQRTGGATIVPSIDVRNRVWYNNELKSRNFIIPGLIAVIMAVMIALLTSLTVAKEWDRGTMEQLVSTPVKPVELVVGKLIPYFVIGIADTVLVILMSTEFFHVPLRGNVALLVSLSAVFLFGGLGLGILISIVGRDQIVATQMSMLSSFLPAFLLSGFIFSISNMPAALQLITYVIPARYFVTILKGIFLKGLTLQYLIWEALLLSAYGVLVFMIAVRKFRKRID